MAATSTVDGKPVVFENGVWRPMTPEEVRRREKEDKLATARRLADEERARADERVRLDEEKKKLKAWRNERYRELMPEVMAEFNRDVSAMLAAAMAGKTSLDGKPIPEQLLALATQVKGMSHEVAHAKVKAVVKKEEQEREAKAAIEKKAEMEKAALALAAKEPTTSKSAEPLVAVPPGHELHIGGKAELKAVPEAEAAGARSIPSPSASVEIGEGQGRMADGGKLAKGEAPPTNELARVNASRVDVVPDPAPPKDEPRGARDMPEPPPAPSTPAVPSKKRESILRRAARAVKGKKKK